MPDRLNELTRWLRADVGLPSFDIAPASADASFRRYFRVRYADQNRIVMDAPPDKEDCRPFIAVARAFHALGLNVPEILEINLDQGFLLLSDLGDRQYLGELDETSAASLYGDAMHALRMLQRPAANRPGLLPPYDRALLLREMTLFRDWFMEKHLGLGTCSRSSRAAVSRGRTEHRNQSLHIVNEDSEHRPAPDHGRAADLEQVLAPDQTLDSVFDTLARSALEQPQVWVHRDYHSRNLMITAHGNPGILDFQDAVTGPVTYDLVSLLRDCYIAWPREQVENWVEEHHGRALEAGIIEDVGLAQFLRWFDLMGVQRHLKAIGIFARLNIRDGKPGYLKDIPRTLGYVIDVSRRYPELDGLSRLIDEMVLPKIASLAR